MQNLGFGAKVWYTFGTMGKKGKFMNILMKRPVSVYLNSVKYAFFPGIVQISCYITSMFIRFVVTPQSIHPLSQITNPFQGLRVAYVIFNLVKLSRNERQRTNSSECWLRVSCLCVSSVFRRKISTSTETA